MRRHANPHPLGPRACAMALILLLVLPCAALAQSPPTFSSRADLVVLSATAVDRRGRPVTDLERHELRVYDERRLQSVEYFSQARDVPARVLLLVDASGSMDGEQKSTSVRMGLVQVLAALSEEDEVALAGFDHRYFGLVNFTHDKQAVLTAFDKLELFGSTALRDALARAAGDVASMGEGRRAVLVLTDGVDTASERTSEEVIASSRALDVPIYAISVVSPVDDPASSRFLKALRPAKATRGAAALERFARLSGGQAFTVSDFAGLRRAALAVAEQLKHQYRLGYDPPAAPVGFRRVEVRSTRKGVSIRTRNGYLPRP